MILPSVIIAVLILVILVLVALLHQQRGRILENRDREFSLKETVTDLTAKLQPFKWRLPESQITTTLEKGRPDVIRRQPTRPPGETIVVDIDDIPNWAREDG